MENRAAGLALTSTGMVLLMATLVLPVPGLTYSLLVGSSILLKGCGTGVIKRRINKTQKAPQ
ncbi:MULTISPECIES: hypothetical protein [Priestia]|jgi:hypothetical protein|uniref:hypothetical protein n=1 Tax=Priestia TaxID=2800373 RepID=UPI001ADCBD38|nr:MULTISPECIES: hypothetical protein [Priestia]MDR7242719.1 hypothetical protein [Priestia megaterium]QTL48042.1 hypothetical protein J5Z55_18410 [Priestia aryabhattai]